MTYRTHDNENSIAAGKTHKVATSRKNRRQICEYLAKMGIEGALDEDFLRAYHPDINANALRMRLKELRDTYRFITEELGVRRKNAGGNMCRVWHITAKGLTALGLDPNANWHSETKAA